MRKIFFWTAILLFFSFIAFSYTVSKELYIQFDFNTTVKMQDRIPAAYDVVFSILSLIGSFEITTFIWLFVVAIALFKRWWKTLIALPLFPLSQVLELFGKLYLLHPGPPFMFFRGVLPFDFPSSHVHTDYSYPSGHMIRMSFLLVVLFFFAMYKTRGFLRYAIQLGIIVLLALVWISRISLGEHWATDVIGGALLGISFGILVGITLPKGNNHSANQRS